MKYQKPIVRDLSELAIASGACATGNFVGTCTATSGGLAGDCAGNGTNAATCSGNGTGVFSSCTPGTFGTNTHCADGDFATP